MVSKFYHTSTYIFIGAQSLQICTNNHPIRVQYKEPIKIENVDEDTYLETFHIMIINLTCLEEILLTLVIIESHTSLMCTF